MDIKYPIIEGLRATYKGKTGTIVSVMKDYAYFNADSNKRGNDGMNLVKISDLVLID